MKISENFRSLKSFINLFYDSFSHQKLIRDIESHRDYPSLLSYFDIINNRSIDCKIFSVSEELIKKAKHPFLAILQDRSNDMILSFISRSDHEFECVINDVIVTLSFEELKKKWLGVLLTFTDGNRDIEIFSSDKVENDFLLVEGKSHGKIIGLRNHLKLETEYSGLFFDIIGNDNKIIAKAKSQLSNCFFKIRGNNNLVIIGEKCRISGSFTLEDSNSSIRVGDETTIENANLSATESKKINIGEDCMLSERIIILTSDSHSIIDNLSRMRINPASDVNIEDHVWIAGNVTVLKGTNIKTGSVIGAGSVVTRDIPENSVAVGNPARIIKSNISWDRNLL